MELGLSKEEEKILRKLDTPAKIQDFLNKLKINFEKNGDTCFSPRKVLETGECHCIEGAMLAAVCLMLQGREPLLVDLTATDDDFDHVIAVFSENGKWGAISKTNHAVLRFREPVYRDIRELVMSYFHEYFRDNGRKTLRSFSEPVNLAEKFGYEWITKEDNVWEVPELLAEVEHFNILDKGQRLRLADELEREVGKIVEWKG